MSADTEPSFAKEYFWSQCSDLRRRWGTLAFWRNPDAPALALKALGYVYLRSPADERSALLWEITVRELARRQELVAAHPRLHAAPTEETT
jgi:hypothetical protein